MNPSATQSSISDEFLLIASDAINNHQSSEGTLRTAISRAYYAVFLTVRDQLFGPDGSNLKKDVRKKLRKKFKKQRQSDPGSHDLIIFAITDVQQSTTVMPLVLSQQVSQLKEARIHADYRYTSVGLGSIPKQNWREYAEEIVPLASYLLTTARKLPSY